MNRNLIGYRNMLGLSQKEIATMIGIAVASYCMKERGQRDFTQSEMQNIVKIFKEHGKNFSMEDIFFRS